LVLNALPPLARLLATRPPGGVQKLPVIAKKAKQSRAADVVAHGSGLHSPPKGTVCADVRCFEAPPQKRTSKETNSRGSLSLWESGTRLMGLSSSIPKESQRRLEKFTPMPVEKSRASPCLSTSVFQTLA